MMPVYLDVEMQPGTLRTVCARRPLITRRPMLLLECPLNYRFRAVVLSSVRYGGEEQIAVEHGVPAELFSELPPNNWGLVAHFLAPLVAGDEIAFTFANPLGAPEARFRCWFGEMHELQRLRKPEPSCKSGGAHEWRTESSAFTRCNRCAGCGAVWVSEPL